MDSQTQFCSRPIFVIGSGRSGTTVLAWALAQHSHLWTSGESYVLWELFGGERGNKGLEMIFQTAEVLGTGSFITAEGVGRDELLRFLGLGVNALYASRSKGNRWIDHTPHQTLMVEVLAKMFPDALFLHALRDGRKVVNSLINFHKVLEPEVKANFLKAGWPLPGVDFTEACKAWRQYSEVAMDFCAKHPTRCLTVRHERLVSDPVECLREVYDFIGVPYEENPINFVQTQRLHSSFASDSAPEGKEQNGSESWQRWTPEQKAIFLKEAGPALIKFDMATEEELRRQFA